MGHRNPAPTKGRLFQSLKALNVDAVTAVLTVRPELIRVTDDRRRNPLHFLCGLPASEKTRDRSRAAGTFPWPASSSSTARLQSTACGRPPSPRTWRPSTCW